MRSFSRFSTASSRARKSRPSPGLLLPLAKELAPGTGGASWAGGLGCTGWAWPAAGMGEGAGAGASGGTAGAVGGAWGAGAGGRQHGAATGACATAPRGSDHSCTGVGAGAGAATCASVERGIPTGRGRAGTPPSLPGMRSGGTISLRRAYRSLITAGDGTLLGSIRQMQVKPGPSSSSLSDGGGLGGRGGGIDRGSHMLATRGAPRPRQIVGLSSRNLA